MTHDLEQELKQFTGTEHYYDHTLFDRTLCTDGTTYLAEKVGAYWLIETIMSYQYTKEVNREQFQVWTLIKTEGDSAVLVADDGNGKEICRQEIGFTDFPMKQVTLWLTNQVLMLPSEY